MITVIDCNNSPKVPSDSSPTTVVPSENLIAYQLKELLGFFHFSMNTFTDLEWGYGNEKLAKFHPSGLDVEKLVETAKTTGLKEQIPQLNFFNVA